MFSRERLSQVGNDPDAPALHRMIKVFQGEETRVNAIIDEIAARRIVRADSLPI